MDVILTFAIILQCLGNMKCVALCCFFVKCLTDSRDLRFVVEGLGDRYRFVFSRDVILCG